MAAPLGNHNAANGKRWSDAVRRAIRTKYGKGLDESLADLAAKLVDAADGGDLQALKEIGDRIDGKPAQAIAVTGEDGGPVRTSLTVEFVGPIPE